MSSFRPSPFRPHPLLGHAHIQTSYGTFFPRRVEDAAWQAAGTRREFTLPDGDRISAYLHVHPDDPERKRPIVLLMHGLESNADAHEQRAKSLKAFKLGYHSIRLNYRGCGEDHLASRFYNGHMIEDVDHVVRTLVAEAPWPIVPIGISLGANMLLRLLSTYGNTPPAQLLGAVAISPPIDFLVTNVAFKQGLNKGYDQYFLRSIKQKLRRRRQLLAHDPERLARLERGLRAKWLEEFDEIVTAPEGGFASARDYYMSASVADGLAAIRVPTLLIHAADDPIIPMSMFDARADLIAANPALTVVYTDRGGHVGFMEHPRAEQPEPWMDNFWSENQALAYVRWLDEGRTPRAGAPTGAEAAGSGA